MNRLIPFCFSLVLVSAQLHAQMDSAGESKPFGIKSGRIVYTFVNGPQSGEKTVTFDDWGNSYKEEVTTLSDTVMLKRTFMEIKKNFPSMPDSMINTRFLPVQHNLLIHTPTQTWKIDLDQRIGYVTPGRGILADPTFFSKTVIGQDTVLGKPCQVVEIQHAFRVWYWEKIPIKKGLAQDMPVKMEEYAIKIDESYTIQPDEFKVPLHVNIH